MAELTEVRLEEIKNEKLVSYEEAWEIIYELISAVRGAWRERDAALERIDVILPSAQRYNAQRKYAARAELLLNQLREAASAYLYSHPCPDGRKVSIGRK